MVATSPRDDKLLPISVVICTLNEEDNIEDCVATVLRNRAAEIIVVDGGSTDKTIERASRLPVRVVRTNRGLGHQHQFGIDLAKQDYIALIHADDRCEDSCLQTLLEEMEREKYWAIKAQTLSSNPKTYWEIGMDLNLRCFLNNVGPTNNIGRPAMFKKGTFDIVRNDPLFTWSSDDTDLSRAMELKGLSQGNGTGIVYRKHLSSMKEYYAQWKRYGEGDGRFVYKYPSRMPQMIFHLGVRYPLLRPAHLIRRGYWRYCGFFVMQGWVRLFSATKEYLLLSLRRNYNSVSSE